MTLGKIAISSVHTKFMNKAPDSLRLMWIEFWKAKTITCIPNMGMHTASKNENDGS